MASSGTSIAVRSANARPFLRRVFRNRDDPQIEWRKVLRRKTRLT